MTTRRYAWRIGALGAGIVATFVALAPPLDRLADRSFAAHMTQHMVLIAVAAPLLVLGDAMPFAAASLPPAARRPVQRLRGWSRGVTPSPWVRGGVHIGVVWAWHVPTLFDAAAASEPLHILEHVTFLVTAGWFWWPVLNPRARASFGEAAGLVYVLAASVLLAIPGALLTFSAVPWYPSYVATEGATAALSDQRLAGLIMWIPAGTVYLAVAAALFLQWLGRIERDQALVDQKPDASAT